MFERLKIEWFSNLSAGRAAVRARTSARRPCN